MAVQYPVIEERLITPNGGDPLMPAGSLEYELRTMLVDPVPMSQQKSIGNSRAVRQIILDRSGTEGESLVICLSAKNYVLFVGSIFRVVPDRQTFANILAMVLLAGASGLIFCPYSGSPDQDGGQYTKLVEVAGDVGLRLLDIVPWSVAGRISIVTSSLLDRGVM